MIPRLYDYTMIARIGTRPITAMEVAQELKIDEEAVTGDFQAYLESLIDAAILQAENMTNRTLIESSFVAYIDDFYPGYSYEIRKSPVNSIDSITATLNGSPEVFPSESYYLSKSPDYSVMALAPGKSWPGSDNIMHAIAVNFNAGYTTLPADLKKAVLMIVGMLYSNRGDCDTAAGPGACSMPVPVRNILKMYRIPSIRVGI